MAVAVTVASSDASPGVIGPAATAGWIAGGPGAASDASNVTFTTFDAEADRAFSRRFLFLRRVLLLPPGASTGAAAVGPTALAVAAGATAAGTAAGAAGGDAAVGSVGCAGGGTMAVAAVLATAVVGGATVAVEDAARKCLRALRSSFVAPG